MHHTIKALGWVIALLWMLLLVLPVTVAFSLMKVAEARNIGIEEPKGYMSNGILALSVPFYVDNAGFYELSDVELKLRLYIGNETIFIPSAKIPNIPAGRMVNSGCNISISLTELISKNKEILTVDTKLNACATLCFRVVSAIALAVSTNITMPWGAPFHGLTIRNITYDPVSHIFSASLHFDNHALFQVNETLTVKLHNFKGEPLGSTIVDVTVPPRGTFSRFFTVFLGDSSRLAHGTFIRLYYLGVPILEVEWFP
ncbi:MAG: hypothetical protein QXW82_03230 [Candidatus Bathyarchaeia archaeon]